MLDVALAMSSNSLGSTDGCDISAIADAWDAEPEIRERLRAGLGIFVEVSENKNYDLRAASKNSILLQPLLVRMRECQRKLPSIDSLRNEVTTLLKLNRREIRDPADVEAPAWHLRKNLGFVKMKVRRQEPSFETGKSVSKFWCLYCLYMFNIGWGCTSSD